MERILENIFRLQVSFQKLLGNDIPKYASSILSKENVEIIKNQILALVDESMEALREIPWKPWKVNNTINLDNFRMELIDIFHFLINLFLYAGMSPQMVWDYFYLKNKTNVQRQKDGY